MHLDMETLEYRKSTEELKETAISIASILYHPETKPRSGDPINDPTNDLIKEQAA